MSLPPMKILSIFQSIAKCLLLYEAFRLSSASFAISWYDSTHSFLLCDFSHISFCVFVLALGSASYLSLHLCWAPDTGAGWLYKSPPGLLVRNTCLCKPSLLCLPSPQALFQDSRYEAQETAFKQPPELTLTSSQR